MNPYIPIYLLSAFLFGSFIAGYTPIIISILYVLMGFFAFLLYWKDKASAVSGSWRVKESTLHIAAIFFGWAGAIIAQHKLRHKTQKKSFRFVFWITVLVNVTFVGWLHTELGGEVLRNFIHGLENLLGRFDTLKSAMPWLLRLTRLQDWLQ